MNGKRVVLKGFGNAATNSSGFSTYTHELGFVPRAVLVVPAAPATYFSLPWGVDSMTATSFRVRWIHAGSAGPLTSNTAGSFMALIFE